MVLPPRVPTLLLFLPPRLFLLPNRTPTAAELFATPPFPSSFAAPLIYGVVEGLEVVGALLLSGERQSNKRSDTSGTGVENESLARSFL